MPERLTCANCGWSVVYIEGRWMHSPTENDECVGVIVSWPSPLGAQDD